MKLISTLFFAMSVITCSSVNESLQSSPTPSPPHSSSPVAEIEYGYPHPVHPTPSRGTGTTVLNGRAKFLPEPAYPKSARAANASGAVVVQVLVDETGKVVSATAINGHPLLRAAAEDAARRAEFAPTLINGLPKTVSGVLSYEFDRKR